MLDPDLISAFVRSVAVVASRRTTLGGALGLALAALWRHVRFEDAAARKKRRKRKKKCKGNTKRCGRKCIPNDDCCNDADCSDITVCRNGACVCPDAGEVVCGDSCVNLATNGTNCGACDIECPFDVCLHGACFCTAEVDCPEACLCASREEGAAACINGVSDQDCEDDGDCPVGAICLIANKCSQPCLE